MHQEGIEKARTSSMGDLREFAKDIIIAMGSVPFVPKGYIYRSSRSTHTRIYPEISKLAQRVLINPRKIDYHTGVFATKITPAKDGKPVTDELTDAKTKESRDTLEVDAALISTGRALYTQGLGLENVSYLSRVS